MGEDGVASAKTVEGRRRNQTDDERGEVCAWRPNPSLNAPRSLLIIGHITSDLGKDHLSWNHTPDNGPFPSAYRFWSGRHRGLGYGNKFLPA
jgi:hypothetical protein